MTLSVDKQHKSHLSEKIKALLILLRGECGLSNREIASKLGVGENYLSNVFNGGKVGSDQLLAGLELLKEVIELRNQSAQAPRDFIKELEVMKLRIEAMQRSLTHYPEHLGQPFLMNEKASSGSAAADALADEIAARVRREAEGPGGGGEK